MEGSFNGGGIGWIEACSATTIFARCTHRSYPSWRCGDDPCARGDEWPVARCRDEPFSPHTSFSCERSIPVSTLTLAQAGQPGEKGAGPAEALADRVALLAVRAQLERAAEPADREALVELVVQAGAVVCPVELGSLPTS